MAIPLQITFRGFSHSETLKVQLHEKTDKLQQYCDNIIACQVVIEKPNHNHAHGNLFDTHIIVTVPGKELVVKNNGAEDAQLSIHKAFENMARQLENHVRKSRDEAKTYSSILSGKIARLIDGEYGFIEGDDGTEFYFNPHHVTHPHFNQLQVGMSVHFVETKGEDGPQARRIKAVD